LDSASRNALLRSAIQSYKPGKMKKNKTLTFRFNYKKIPVKIEKEKMQESIEKKNISRKEPKYYSILGSMKFFEAIEMAVTAFKDFMSKNNRNYNFFNIYNKQKKYYKRFFEMVSNLCKLVYSVDKYIRLTKLNFLRICIDYFKALGLTYENMGVGIFQINQISSVYAMESFQKYCTNEYMTLERYFDIAIKVHKSKVRKTKIVEEEPFKKDKWDYEKDSSGVYSLL